MHAPIVGLDIGGTKTAVVAGDYRGSVAHRFEFATNPSRGFDAFFDELNDAIASVRTRGFTPAVVSVSIGGPLQIDLGVLGDIPNLPTWAGVRLQERLADALGLPVYIEHDGNAGALAEWYFGAARGARNVIFLTMGTGFGGGLILNGQLYRGTCDLAGEVGHIRVAETGPFAFGKAGSWEGLCGGAGIVKQAHARFPQRWSDDPRAMREIAAAAHAGDADALALLTDVGHHLGRGLAILLDVLNPEVIVIGSLAVRLGELVLGPARGVMQREALPGAFAACRLVPAALGEQLGDVAALCAAIHAHSAAHPV